MRQKLQLIAHIKIIKHLAFNNKLLQKTILISLQKKKNTEQKDSKKTENYLVCRPTFNVVAKDCVTDTLPRVQ